MASHISHQEQNGPWMPQLLQDVASFSRCVYGGGRGKYADPLMEERARHVCRSNILSMARGSAVLHISRLEWTYMGMRYGVET